jgi:hypothetical protein
MPPNAWYIVRAGTASPALRVGPHEKPLADKVAALLGEDFCVHPAGEIDWVKWDEQLERRWAAIEAYECHLWGAVPLDRGEPLSAEEIEGALDVAFADDADLLRARRYEARLREGAAPGVAPAVHSPSAASQICQPDFVVTTDLRATSDPFWKAMAEFRRRMLEGEVPAEGGWVSLVVEIRRLASQAKMASRAFEMLPPIAIWSEMRAAVADFPHPTSGGDPTTVFMVGVDAFAGDFEFDPSVKLPSDAERSILARWAGSWMNERESSIVAQAGNLQSVQQAVERLIPLVEQRNREATAGQRLIPIAAVAAAVNMRGDQLKEMLIARGHTIHGKRRRYSADLKDILSTLPRFRKSLTEWADKEFPLP